MKPKHAEKAQLFSASFSTSENVSCRCIQNSVFQDGNMDTAERIDNLCFFLPPALMYYYEFPDQQGGH